MNLDRLRTFSVLAGSLHFRRTAETLHLSQSAVSPLLEAAGSRGMKMKYVIDTHIQADHRSGGRLLAEKSGASYALHRGAVVGFAFEPLDDAAVLRFNQGLGV